MGRGVGGVNAFEVSINYTQYRNAFEFTNAVCEKNEQSKSMGRTTDLDEQDANIVCGRRPPAAVGLA